MRPSHENAQISGVLRDCDGGRPDALDPCRLRVDRASAGIVPEHAAKTGRPVGGRWERRRVHGADQRDKKADTRGGSAE